MVKKLLKYEFFAYIRTLFPMQLILLGIALLCRFIQFFEADNTPYNIVFISSVVVLVVSSIVCVVMTMIFGITRFYKNLFSTEGYLSFTLPVTPAQHLFSKSVMLITFTVITFITILLGVFIATAGDVLLEIFKAVGYLLKEFFKATKVHGIFYVIEAIIAVITIFVYQTIMFYSCITIGQTAKKNRILAAFGVYFIYYFITQILGTIFILTISWLDSSGLLREIGYFVSNHPYAFVHIFFCAFIILFALLSAVFYFISHRIMKNKLNLE